MLYTWSRSSNWGASCLVAVVMFAGVVAFACSGYALYHRGIGLKEKIGLEL